MEQLRYIPEHEFAEDFARRLQEMARAVAFSGLTLSEIASAARVKWDTVYKVSQGRPVRMDNAARILYFLEVHEKEKTQNQQKSIKVTKET